MSDYLMPHREAAWVVLEERLREAANFCRLICEIAPAEIGAQLAPVGGALDEIADSLAAHFGDWGGTSRFAHLSRDGATADPDAATTTIAKAAGSVAAKLKPAAARAVPLVSASDWVMATCPCVQRPMV